MSTTQELTSVGRIASELGVLKPVIDSVAAELGIAPEITIDRVALYTPQQAERITERLRERAGEKP